MSHLEALLVARCHRVGRGHRTAIFRHRRLLDHPIVLALYQLGAEPFSAAAAVVGTSPDDALHLVAGEPRNRDLAFAMLLDLARWFNPRFEQPGAIRGEDGRAVATPQVIVPNKATIDMIGRLGRRLAYLPIDGPNPADPELVRLGQHFLFLARHASLPGQQVMIAVADLVAMHWATEQSEFERASLTALDAYVDPVHSPAWEWERRHRTADAAWEWEAARRGAHGFDAAALAERFAIGPLPDGEDDRRLAPLVDKFNVQRDGCKELAVVGPLLGPIHDHYRPLLDRAWELLWHALARERAYPEASSVGGRWHADVDAYSWYLDWLATDKRPRTRQTPKQAAMTMRRLEAAKARLLAQEACDDPLRMIPYTLINKAVEGEVVALDLNNREVANVNRVRRPLVTLLTEEPCPIPPGRELWWAGHPQGAPWEVRRIVGQNNGGALVTLRLTTSSTRMPMPTIGDRTFFSVHHTDGDWMPNLPPMAPWSHRPRESHSPFASIEEDAS